MSGFTSPSATGSGPDGRDESGAPAAAVPGAGAPRAGASPDPLPGAAAFGDVLPGAAAVRAAAAAMLRGGAVPALVVGVLAVAVGALSGPGGAAGAAVALALAAVVLPVGPVLLRAGSTWSPRAVMAAAVLGYGVSVTLLGAAFVALSPASWLSADHLGASLVAVTVGWLTGQVRAVARLRVPVFDVPLPSEAGGEAGDPAGGRPGARPGVRSRAPGADPDDRQARPAGR